jgi:hypothetical protein
VRLPTLRHRPDAEPHAASWSDCDDRPVAELLERYAATSLSPDDAALSRMGAAVRAAFVESLAEREAGPAPESPSHAGRRGGMHLQWSRRRAVAAFCAVAILSLSTFGFAAAESGPGQPFYRLRLGIETVNQPPAGSQSRLDADLGRADARLDDIAASAGSSDWNAAADAAGAYREVLAAVTLPTDATARAQAHKQLSDQLARLEQLRARSHGSASAELDGAIAALCNLLGIPVPTPPGSVSPNPGSIPSDHAEEAGSTPPGQTGSDGGHDHGKSPAPSPSAGAGGPGGPDGGGSGSSDGRGSGSSDGRGGLASPAPKPTGNSEHTPGPTEQPSEGH